MLSEIAIPAFGIRESWGPSVFRLYTLVGLPWLCNLCLNLPDGTQAPVLVFAERMGRRDVLIHGPGEGRELN